MIPLLTVESPAGDRDSVEVRATPFLIGRQAGNHLVLRDNRISRLHAQILLRGAEAVIQDCASTLGLFVNGQKVEHERTLAAGDAITFGSTAGGAYDSYRLHFHWREANALPGLVDRMPGEEHLAKLRSLVEVARALHASLAPDEVLSAVVEAALKLTGATSGYLLLKQDGGLVVRLARDAPGRTADSLPWDRIRSLLNDRAIPAAASWDGALCVPLMRVRTELSQQTVAFSLADTIGALYLEAPGKPDLAAGNRELLETLAVEAASVLENAALLEQDQERRRMEQELEIARRIQRSLLPRKLPDDGWLRAAGSSEPTLEVGGDFYDLIRVREDLWSIAMADVSGKGASAALLAGLLQGAFLMAPENTAGIIAMLDRLNRYLHERTGGEKYATVFYGALGQDGMLRWANAGHCTPYLIHNAGIEALETNALPVGLMEQTQFAVNKTQLAPGEKLVIFSDGLAEATNEASGKGGETFERTLRRILRKSGHSLPPAELHALILAEVQSFTRGRPQPDDLTLLIADFRGGPV